MRRKLPKGQTTIRVSRSKFVLTSQMRLQRAPAGSVVSFSLPTSLCLAKERSCMKKTEEKERGTESKGALE